MLYEQPQQIKLGFWTPIRYETCFDAWRRSKMQRWQKRWFEGKMPEAARPLLDRVFAARTREEAKEILMGLAKVHIEHFNLDAHEALEEARIDVGYVGGYGTAAERDAVEKLFGVEHPLFGSYAKNGPPDPKKAFELGMEMGERVRRERESN